LRNFGRQRRERHQQKERPCSGFHNFIISR
jgi:hypothetical protein